MTARRPQRPASDAECVAPQCRTRAATAEDILRSRDFKAGVEELRAGRPSRFDVFANGDWSYERGRLFAMVAPMSMPLRVRGKLNKPAVRLLIEGFRRGDIL